MKRVLAYIVFIGIISFFGYGLFILVKAEGWMVFRTPILVGIIGGLFCWSIDVIFIRKKKSKAWKEIDERTRFGLPNRPRKP
jgi:hypothetical protein